MTGIPIKGTAQGNAGVAFNIAKRRGAQRLDFLLAYLTELYTFAPTYGINADVMVSQADLETNSFRSLYYTRDGNVAGFGAFDDGTNLGLQYTAVAAARGQVIHHCVYVGIPVPKGDQAFDPRYQAVFTAGYNGKVETTADYGKGLWATDPEYSRKLLERYEAYFGTPVIEDEPVAEVTKDDIYALVVAGHHGVGDGGNPVERNLTDDLARADYEALKAAGFKTDILYRIDGDSDDEFTAGGLDGVAKKTAAIIASRSEKYVIVADDHYNGSKSAIHAIVADVGNLTTAYSGGAPRDDTASNNKLDVDLAEAFSKELMNVAPSGSGLSLFRGKLNRPGVMSEQETGVGLQGFRLAMMAATAKYRAKAIRITIEHAGTSQFFGTPAGFKASAQAKIRAINKVFGLSGTGPSPDPDPAPYPVYAKPILIEGIDPDKIVQVVDNSMFVKTGYDVVALRNTPRLQKAYEGAERLGPDIKQGETFSTEQAFIADDGNGYLYTKYGTRVRAVDVAKV